jgi:diguanylate cyclase (GGDEF)-like protein
VTISVGVAAVLQSGETLLDALTRADNGLYAAKRAGRNRVVAATDAYRK